MKKILLLLCLFSVVSCAGKYRVDANPGALKATTARVLPAQGAEGDKACKRGIEAELRKRNFTLVETSSTGENHEELLVRYNDEWKWDMLMYLWAMDVSFADAKSGQIKATVHYQNRFWHTFPDPKNIARRAFAALDKKGVFVK